MRPLGGRVLLKRPPISELIGRIVIPDKFQMIPQEGVVLAISAGEPHTCSACGHTERRASAVEVGQTVLHGRYSRMSVPGSEDEYLVFEKDLMCVLGDA